MADNSTNSTSSGGGGDDGGNNDALNWVALVVSLVALLGTIAQVLQQYYASAAGFANCGENVMGQWYKTTKRIFRPTELRFEVQFEAPVIFVCPPTNKNGPVKLVPIEFVSGTADSLQRTRSLPAGEEEKQRQATRENTVHTADNERATWVTLLSQLHNMERESRDWQELHYGPHNPGTVEEQLQNPELAGHTLAVALQAKQRSWDTMPTDVKKPYATTTICHLLEIAAMLGVYWKEFDRSRDRYRAEGNGYILTGTQITDLGLMFTFQISGGSRFKENRVIPADEVKELCCGSVSTIFRADKDSRRLGVLNEDPRDLGMLQLGHLNEIAETMVLIDCNTITASYFRNPSAKHTHLFPVPFELVGMLCKNLHIPGTPFRMVPNPTPYHWDKKFFNLRKLMNEYHKRMKNLKGIRGLDEFVETTGRVVHELHENKKKERARRLQEQAIVNEKKEAIQKEKEKQASLRGSIKGAPEEQRPAVEPAKTPPKWRQKVNEVLARVGISKPEKKPSRDEESQAPSTDKLQCEPRIQTPDHGKPADKVPESRPGYSMELLKALDTAIAECDKHLLREHRGLVRTVIREHFQEVLKLLNGDDEDEDSVPAGPSGRSDDGRRKARRFEELRAASPEDRQRIFMDIYFSEILDEVKKRAAKSLSKMTFYHPPNPSNTPPSSPKSVRSAFLQPPDIISGDPSDAESDTGNGTKEEAKHLEPRAAAIWCVLIFRMLCWLILHDFDKNDVQISKSELLGSRLPVYIA
ncbi:hypothetical protein QBC47DRAFT_117818 [Echria macrotheca]|uniref:Modin n=1 Tax=Echria macrotheca TaxID=438768 RepID=A0AAJ0BL62_9PEZI|nr:hypothetical protein QBC47DRAFT_117818 [Echria macrotheca]